ERDRGVLPLEPVRADPDADPRGRGGRAAGAEDVDLPERVRVVALAGQCVAGVCSDVCGVLVGCHVGVVSAEDLHQGIGAAARACGARWVPGPHGPWALALRAWAPAVGLGAAAPAGPLESARSR